MSVLPAPRTHIPEKEAVATAVPLPIDVGVPPAPHIITEQEVVFGTAAAAPARPTHWWTAATRVVDLAKERLFFAYPPRLDFLENSLMEREMHRL
jgi:hypothetical protein